MRSRVPQSTNGGIPHDLPKLSMQRQFIVERPQSVPSAQPLQHFLLAYRTDPAGYTLATGLVPKEGRNTQQDGLHIDRLVQDHYYP